MLFIIYILFYTTYIIKRTEKNDFYNIVVIRIS